MTIPTHARNISAEIRQREINAEAREWCETRGHNLINAKRDGDNLVIEYIHRDGMEYTTSFVGQFSPRKPSIGEVLENIKGDVLEHAWDDTDHCPCCGRYWD